MEYYLTCRTCGVQCGVGTNWNKLALDALIRQRHTLLDLSFGLAGLRWALVFDDVPESREWVEFLLTHAIPHVLVVADEYGISHDPRNERTHVVLGDPSFASALNPVARCSCPTNLPVAPGTSLSGTCPRHGGWLIMGTSVTVGE